MTILDDQAVREAAGKLQELAGELTGWGFHAQLRQSQGQAYIHVASSASRQLAGKVYAAPADDGDWWFWWTGADRIARIHEVDVAAFKIAYLLTPDADD
jgi:hypothetical protein